MMNEQDKESPCEKCGQDKVQMYVGGNTTPRRIIWVCPECEGKGERYQISNNHGHINGWIGKSGLFGKVIKVEN